MRNQPLSFSARSSLTRISVSGSGDHYMVRNGGEAPVRVWVCEDSFRCECGKPNCAHIASLEVCGFIEPPYEERMAA